MYGFLSHQVEIHDSWQRVFKMCLEVEHWSTFMPAVRSARVMERNIDSDVVEITASVNEEVHTWCSRRSFSLDSRLIAFERIDPVAPIKVMKGVWIMTPLNDAKCFLTLTHEFELDQHNREKFERIISAIRRNASTDLKALQEKAFVMK